MLPGDHANQVTAPGQPGWDPLWPARSPIFAPLREAAIHLGAGESWPDMEAGNRMLRSAANPILTHSGKPVRLVPQAADPYEKRIYLTGEVQTRGENWHDLFNALVWRTFPRTKAALNQLHFLNASTRSVRGTLRDRVTLFDESGAVVACDAEELASLLRQHRWKELFWVQRNQVARHLRFYVFGHSLHEKSLRPYLGLTGKALILPVTRSFFDQPLACQLDELDGMMADHFLHRDSLLAATSLTALPLLGVPGWWPDNEKQVFYENTRYFRPARQIS